MNRRRFFIFATSLGITVRRAAAATPQNFAMNETPKAMPELQFTDSEGKALTLANFKDKVVLLNIWATWCAPCR